MVSFAITQLKLKKITFLILFSCLLAIFFSGFDTFISKGRDIKRKADIKTLQTALDLYHDKYNYYPESENDWLSWDLTYEYKGDELSFLKVLKDEGFIDKMVFDPLNTANYHYRYQKFSAGSYGCKKAFYILQLSSFELATKNFGRGECPELNWAEIVPSGYTVQAFE